MWSIRTDAILGTAQWLLTSALPRIESEGLTLVGIAVANLEDDRAVQFFLPFGCRSRAALDAAVDEIRERFESGAMTRALLGRDPGLLVPLLPD
jgi:DNA polymerase-4